ncbi:ephrin type-A receptor 4 isoform X2 [Ciona intestinalis]
MNTVLLWTVLFASPMLELTQGREQILLDTRTALSDLGWTKSQGSEWMEVTGDDENQNEHRMLFVCQITQPNQNNWLRTQYIRVDGARRIYVEVQFTMRSCEDVPNVATCKETFNLYYYETDRDEATSTFPPWGEGAYVKVDTIAADQRFRPGSDKVVNFERRNIGPISKNGIYLAIQDTGACVAIMHVKVYYKYCGETLKNLASFSRTISGPQVTDLVKTRGSCVRNAITEDGQYPIYHCGGIGNWTVPTGTCFCTAGYEPNFSRTQCNACARNRYKSVVKNVACRRCPAYSSSSNRGATVCDCMNGYFRAHEDTADQPCTKPPTKVVNLYAAVNQSTSVTLTWERPLNEGGRTDLTYSIECNQCQPGFVDCTTCTERADYEPRKTGLVATHVTVKNLRLYAFYKFKVIATNGVTDIASASGQQLYNFAMVNIERNQAAPSPVLNVRSSELDSTSVMIRWDAPTLINGHVLDYEVTAQPSKTRMALEHIASGISKSSFKTNRTSNRYWRIVGLEPSNDYLIKVRARTMAGFGPYSIPIKIKTLNKSTTTVAINSRTSGSGPDYLLFVAIGGGILFVVAIVIVIVIIRRRRRTVKSKKLKSEKSMYNGVSVTFNSSFQSNHKTYIDPTTYEDPQRAVSEFTKEIDATYIKIEQVIGAGEFGEVCRGRLQLPNKPESDVAIKTLKTGYSTQQKLDFLGEASIMGQFDHPNVIRLEGVVTKSRPLMIITEFMENGSLDAFLRNHDNGFNVIQLVGILRNIAAGMKYLSDMGYVHRDLAARNILVNAQLICKVSDFGMSRVLEEDSDAAYTARCGKIPIRWTAPEAFTYRKFTSASDVWSYGIVMWEVMSYGERPYWGMSNRDVMNAVETGYRLPAPMDCPQVQHKLMLDCWKKDRNQRPKFGQIVSSLDKMLRDPSQLKAKANEEGSRPVGGNTALRTAPPQFTANGHANRRSHTIINQAPDSGYIEETDEEVPLVSSNGVDEPRHTELDVWLERRGFSQFKDNFIRNGCNCVEQIQQLTHSDLDRMGITSAEDQDVLLSAIQTLSNVPDIPNYGEACRTAAISV